MKSKVSTIFLILILLAGLSLLLYPTFSEWWNSKRQTQVITHYAEAVADMDNEDYDRVLESASRYNEDLLGRFNPYTLTEELKARYPQELNFAGDGIMCYVQIPSIDVMLPVYHSTAEEILQVAVGHLDWTSLPTGGVNTHCVISSHRGLPSARLFTDLDQLVEGDIFTITVLDETLTYEVDQIKIVEPHETQDLLVVEGEDYFTLVTCTPYGVNTHRLLVRGRRIDNIEEAAVIRVTGDAFLVKKMVVVPFVLVPILLIMLVGMLISTGRQQRRRRPNEEKNM